MTEPSGFFDPWLMVKRSRFIDAIVANLSTDFTGTGEGRKRRRRVRDKANLEAILRAVVANLACSVVTGSGPIVTPLAAPQGKRKAHVRRGFRQLPKVLVRLDSTGMLKLDKSRRRGVASTIEPSESFAATARSLGIGPADFGRVDEDRETVFVTRPMVRHEQGGRRMTRLYEAPDTPEACRYREELRRINDALAAADLKPRDDPRGLVRYFHDAALKTGGRLYGGFWQTLPKPERHRIRIDGEPIALVDFASMFPRLAYMAAGKAPPAGDLYAGIPGEREGVKKVFNAMLFRTGPLQRFPRGSRKHFPRDATAATVRAAILARHPELAPIFETGIGLRLMRTESDILVAGLLRLIERGITALPIHDAVLVKKSAAHQTARVMRDTAERLTGCRLPVRISLCVRHTRSLSVSASE